MTHQTKEKQRSAECSASQKNKLYEIPDRDKQDQPKRGATDSVNMTLYSTVTDSAH